MQSDLFNFFEINANSQIAAFAQISSLTSKILSVDETKVLESLQQRERVANTALIDGIALPHIIVNEIEKPSIFVFLNKQSIEDWYDLNNEKIRILICYVLPSNITYTNTDVRALQQFSVKLADEQFVNKIGSCKALIDLRDTILEK